MIKGNIRESREYCKVKILTYWVKLHNCNLKRGKMEAIF